MGLRAAVLKIGGSVLSGIEDYHRSAGLLRDQLRTDPECRLLVVVSAEAGTTDALERLACEIVSPPDPRLLDLLWSIGERKSAALLALCLQRAGVDATALDIQQIGLEVTRDATNPKAGGGAPRAPKFAQLTPARLLHELKRHPVVVIPGFLGIDGDGGVVSLGRGGSDLTAVLFACELGAERCELIKDVPGYFTADRHKDASARPIPVLTHEAAVAMARAGCDLVQLRALEEAGRRRLTLMVRSLDGDGPGTRVASDVGSAGLVARAFIARDGADHEGPPYDPGQESGEPTTWHAGASPGEWAIG